MLYFVLFSWKSQASIHVFIESVYYIGRSRPKGGWTTWTSRRGTKSNEDDVVCDNKEEECLSRLAKKPFYPFFNGKLMDAYTITDYMKPKNLLYDSSW